MNKPPSLIRMLAAILYDSLILFGLLMGATALLLPFTHGQSIPQGTYSYQLYLLIVIYLYFDICWRKSGQTIGMQAWKIRLISDSGHTTRQQTLMRFLAAFLSAGVLGLGYWVALFPKHLTWHDRLSGTRIVDCAPQATDK